MAEKVLDPEILAQIEMITALRGTDPALEKAWQAYLVDNMGEFRAQILASKFYTTNNATARQRQTAKVNQAGVYGTELDEFKLKVKKRLVQSGVEWTAGVEAQVTNGFDNGMSDDRIDQLIIKSGGANKLGGTNVSVISGLQSYAKSFGVGNLFNSTYWDSKSKSLFAGETTDDDIMNDIKTMAAGAFPAYADGIKNNVSLSALASNVTSSVASLLELDPDTIDFDNPLVKRIMGYTNPSTGKQEVMPQWMVEKTVKGSKEWLYTNNARDSLDSLTTKVFRDWGLI